jgi:hypothetical protein
VAFTTIQYLKLVQVAVATAATTQYTVPASRQDVIKDYEVCNTTGAAITFTFNVVPTGGSASTANQVLSSASIPANQTFHWTGTIVMNAGDFLSTAASATGLTLTVSGLESQ